MKKPACILAQGEVVGGVPKVWRGAVGFDPKGEFIYAPEAQKGDFKFGIAYPSISVVHEFAVFSIGGVKKKAYALDPWSLQTTSRVLQYLVHPAGGRVVVLTNGPTSYAVEMAGK